MCIFTFAVIQHTIDSFTTMIDNLYCFRGWNRTSIRLDSEIIDRQNHRDSGFHWRKNVDLRGGVDIWGLVAQFGKDWISHILWMCCVLLFLFVKTLDAQVYSIPTRFSASPIPPEPDYSKATFWSALPTKIDQADQYPRGYNENQSAANADVFFVHPSTFIKKPKSKYCWNRDLRDTTAYNLIDDSPSKFQASAFNLAAKVYVPRYREAHYYVFLTQYKEDKIAALDIAYSDVKTAFLYYLEHFNNGRPFIIASHSQGTILAARLLKEHIVGKPLQQKLVAAYLIGMPVPTDSLPGLPVCKNDSATGCFVSWCTYERDYIPPWYPLALDRAVCINPISWEYNQDLVGKERHLGAVLKPLDNPLPHICDAQVHGGLLWVTKPKFKGSIFFRSKNFHKGDINLFYLDIRFNALRRVQSFQKKTPE